LPDFTLSRAATPLLGFFWVVQMTAEDWGIVSVLHKFEEVPELAGFRTVNEGHVDAWPRLGGHLDPDYGAFPRGRVNWRMEDDRLLLLLDPVLLRRGWTPRLLEHFALDPAHTTVMTDPHYRSRRHPPVTV
jgi:hypothetical protein